MNRIFTIDSAAALQQFIHTVDGLHDALLHEAVLLHPGYVDGQRRMFGDSALPNARILFQSQLNEVPGIQLDLKQVSHFRLEFTRDFQLEGELAPDALVLFPHGKRNANVSEIRAVQGEFRVLGEEILGPRYQFVRV